MKILYVNSDIIKKNDMVWGLLEAGFDTEIYESIVTMNLIIPEELEALLRVVSEYDVITSQNFIPAVAVACHEKGVKYASWIYDSPQYHLFSKEARFDTNYVFAFDKIQVKNLRKTGIKNVFYLPLAANTTKASMVSITDEDVKNYSCDISFIGGLYEKNSYRDFYEKAPQTVKEELERVLSDNFFSWGKGKSVYDELSEETSSLLTLAMSGEKSNALYKADFLKAAKTLVLVYELACRERKTLLSESAKYFNTVFYTKTPEDGKFSDKLIVKGPVYEENLYKAYYLSKINLNITMRSIESGIPLRVFDIMAVGGCVFTNFQEEVGELFNIDKDIVVYHCMDEYLEKAKYYLKHDKERETIGVNGYVRVRDEYNCKSALLKMMRIVSEN